MTATASPTINNGILVLSGIGTLQSIANTYQAGKFYLQDKTSQAAKAFGLHAVVCAGWGTWTLDWAHRMQMIDLGASLPLIRGGCYVAWAVSQFYAAIIHYKAYQVENDPEQKRLLFFKTAASVTTIAFSVLGLATMCTGVVAQNLMDLIVLAAVISTGYVLINDKPAPPKHT